MTPNPQYYVSIELARKLMKAGIMFGDSEKVWARWTYEGATTNWELMERNALSLIYTTFNNKDIEILPASSLNEILDRLPVGYAIEKIKRHSLPDPDYMCYEYIDKKIANYEIEPTAPDAAAKMLLAIGREKENERLREGFEQIKLSLQKTPVYDSKATNIMIQKEIIPIVKQALEKNK